MKPLLISLLAMGLSAVATAPRAQPLDLLEASSTSDRPAPVSHSIVREISLGDLGYADGLEFGRLSADATLYFPVPDARPVLGGTLRLDLLHGATNGAERYLKISVGNRVLDTQALDAEGGTLEIAVPIGADDVRDGFVAVGLRYSGAYSDRICIDERVSGDFLTVAPTSGLALAIDPARIDSPRLLAAFMPRDVRIRFPEEAPVDMALAVSAAAAFGAEAGHLSYGTVPQIRGDDVWRTAQIVVAPAGPRGASEMNVAMVGGAPVLRIAGLDPQVGLRQLGSIWAGLAGGAVARTEIALPAARDGDSLPLAGLRGGLEARTVASDTAFEMSFAAASIPSGKRIDAVDLIVASALDPLGRGASVTAFLNDSLLGSRPLGSGDPERMTFAIPDGLVGQANNLRILVQRQPSGGNCADKVQGYPAQVLPGSAFRLADDASAPRDFFRMSQAFSDGAALVVDPTLDMPREELLDWVGAIAGAILPDAAPVVAASGLDAARGPFLYVSHRPPAGSEPRLRLDDGAIGIVDGAGAALFDGPALDRVGHVEIVSVDGVEGLWIRPGNGPAPAPTDRAPLILDRGDLALIDETGLLVATSGARPDLISVTYADRGSAAQILSNYRPWVLGGAWAILTLLVLGFLQRRHRGRAAADGRD